MNLASTVLPSPEDLVPDLIHNLLLIGMNDIHKVKLL